MAQRSAAGHPGSRIHARGWRGLSSSLWALIGAGVLVAAACAPAAGPASPTPGAPAAAPAKPTAGAPAATQAPAAPPAAAGGQPAAAAGRAVVAVASWGTERSLPWLTAASDKILWDVVYDPVILRDPQTLKHQPGLATSWSASADYKSWTFKLRQGVMFHGDYGEMTSEDFKFTVEQCLKPDATSLSCTAIRSTLDRIETPDRSTVIVHYKQPNWSELGEFVQTTGNFNITSKKYVEQVGEQQAGLKPIGTGPYRYVDGTQGSVHRFEAVPNHWRVQPAFKELVVRRVSDESTRLAGLRAGEFDVASVSGDLLEQAKQGGFKIKESPKATAYWVALHGQWLPAREEYCPTCPWVGDRSDPASQERARQVRLAMNLAVNKQVIVENLWRGAGEVSAFVPYYYPFHDGFSKDWTVPPYDPARAREILAKAGYPNGFEIRANPMVTPYTPDGPLAMEAVALDWEKVGIKVKRLPEDWGTFSLKLRTRKTSQMAYVYGSTPSDEPANSWRRTFHSKGASGFVAEYPEWDAMIDAASNELDRARRTQLENQIGQKMYDDLPVVMIGWKTSTWALSRKIGTWPALPFTPLETNLANMTPAAP